MRARRGCLGESNNEPVPLRSFQKILELETHLEKRLDSPTYKILRVNLMMFFRSVLGLDFDEETILGICAALDTNAFEIRKPGQKIRALYPNAAMLAHNCRPNTRHYFGDNHELFFVATVPVRKGEVLYTTYGQALQVIRGTGPRCRRPLTLPPFRSPRCRGAATCARASSSTAPANGARTRRSSASSAAPCSAPSAAARR